MKRVVIIDDHITCSKCGETKNKMFFYKRPENNSYRGVCNLCSKGYKTSRIVNIQECYQLFEQGLRKCRACEEIKTIDLFDKDKHRPNGLTIYCRDCRSEYRMSEIAKNNTLLRTYGITLKDYDDLLEKQNNKCAICEIVLEDRKNSFVDHCHNSSKVRGILCPFCNWGLGHFKDNVENLYNAIAYLKNHTNDNQTTSSI